MSDEIKNEFWRRNLVGVENPLVHFVPSRWLDVEALEKASGELGLVFFLIDARHVQSVSALMDAFARSMNFTSPFGNNWDALLDLTTDLSWIKVKGYVLILSNADSLLFLPNNGFSVLLGVMEATVRNWRDERGEYRERTGPVPFQVIFSGSNAVRERLLQEMKEPLCEHRSNSDIRIHRITGGIGSTEGFHDAKRLLRAGADLELVLVFLRDRRYSHSDSIYAVAALMEKSIPEAKEMVDHSKIWSATLGDEEIRRREWARKALRDLGFS